MGPGLSLMVIGAILTFAVRDEMDAVNIPVVGVILMLAGLAVLVNARRRESLETVTEHEVDHVGDDGRGGTTREVEHETRREHHPD